MCLFLCRLSVRLSSQGFVSMYLPMHACWCKRGVFCLYVWMHLSKNTSNLCTGMCDCVLHMVHWYASVYLHVSRARSAPCAASKNEPSRAKNPATLCCALHPEHVFMYVYASLSLKHTLSGGSCRGRWHGRNSRMVRTEHQAKWAKQRSQKGVLGVRKIRWFHRNGKIQSQTTM